MPIQTAVVVPLRSKQLSKRSLDQISVLSQNEREKEIRSALKVLSLSPKWSLPPEQGRKLSTSMGDLSPLSVLCNHGFNQAMLPASCYRIADSPVRSYLCQTCIISFGIDIIITVLHRSIQHLRKKNDKLDRIAELWGWMLGQERPANHANDLTPARPRGGDRGRVQKRRRKRRSAVPRRENSQERERRHYRMRHPEEFPDLDFHQSFGSFLTRKNPVHKTVNREIAGYWRLLCQTPSAIQYHYFDIRELYQKKFRQYFKAQVISLHGHVSDAANPNLLMSLLLHLTAAAEVSESDPASSAANDPEDDPTRYSAGNSVNDDANTPANDDGNIPANVDASSSATDYASDSTSGYTVVGADLLEHANRQNPRIALAQGSYGATFGPMAYECVLPFVQPVANGPEPFFVNTQDLTTINNQVREAKAAGCIALIVEIVCATDGSVISIVAWRHLLSACREHCLVLIVDEALTAMRCGAPFAYQLPRYAKAGFPDLVLFGKAVRTNGIAVEWRGINIQKLGIKSREKRLDAILDWQDRFTALATAQDLLASWGTLILAHREDWKTRAPTIGRLLRSLLRREGIMPQLISGLHGLIYIRREDYITRSPIMVANSGTYVRLLPTMDEVMTSRAQLLTKVFGASSIPHRAEFAAFLQGEDYDLHWCSKCGLAVEEDKSKICERCVVRQCAQCEPVNVHVCPM